MDTTIKVEHTWNSLEPFLESLQENHVNVLSFAWDLEMWFLWNLAISKCIWIDSMWVSHRELYGASIQPFFSFLKSWKITFIFHGYWKEFLTSSRNRKKIEILIENWCILLHVKNIWRIMKVWKTCFSTQISNKSFGIEPLLNWIWFSPSKLRKTLGG